MPTFSDYLYQQTGGAVQPVDGVWVQLVNNATLLTYVSQAPTGPPAAHGLFTISAPAGLYTMNTGPSSSGPWTPTGDGNYPVADEPGWFNAKDYGSYGTGVADSAPAIQAAVNACQNAGGGVVLMPPATLDILSAIQITANVRVIVLAWGVTLRPAANIDALFISQANGATALGCEVYGLLIDGQSRAGVVGCRIRDTDRAQLRSCRIQNCVTGVQVESFTATRFAEENSIQDSFISNCTTGVNFAAPGGTGSLGETHMFNVGVQGCATGIALNNPCTFYRCRLMGITIWPATGGVGLKIDCDVRDSVFIVDLENVGGANLTGVQVTANAVNLDKLQAHFAFTGVFTTPVSDPTPKGLVWSDGTHYLTTAAFSGIIQDWGLFGEAFPRVRVGPSFTGGGGIQFGIGSGSPDVNVFRAGLGTLGTNGAFARSKQTPTEAVLVSGVDATLGEWVEVTLTAARVVGAPLNPLVGQELGFTLIEGGAGAFAVTWNAVFKLTWSNAGNVAGTRASVKFWYDGTNWNAMHAQAPFV
jgi:hypothetical protein